MNQMNEMGKAAASFAMGHRPSTPVGPKRVRVRKDLAQSVGKDALSRFHTVSADDEPSPPALDVERYLKMKRKYLALKHDQRVNTLHTDLRENRWKFATGTAGMRSAPAGF